jgi:hypothetical protein
MVLKRRGLAKKRSIVAGSHSHYFFSHNNAFVYPYKKYVGAASCRDTIIDDE